MKKLLTLLIIVAVVPVSVSAGLKKLDISPMVLINLDETRAIDSDSRLLGGALAGDFYFSRHFALRASVGYVRNLYNTSVSKIDVLSGDPQILENQNYSLRFSIAPYADASIGGIFRPYATLTGGFGYTENTSDIADISAPGSQVLSNSRYVTARTPSGGFYDFTGAIGIKVLIASSVSLFGEVSHRIYSSLDWGDYYSADGQYRMVPFGFDHYKTLLSLGLTYSINLSGD